MENYARSMLPLVRVIDWRKSCLSRDSRLQMSVNVYRIFLFLSLLKWPLYSPLKWWRFSYCLLPFHEQALSTVLRTTAVFNDNMQFLGIRAVDRSTWNFALLVISVINEPKIVRIVWWERPRHLTISFFACDHIDQAARPILTHNSSNDCRNRLSLEGLCQWGWEIRRSKDKRRRK